jgi:DNA-binding NarL/FixJ family response regulator
MLYVEVGPPFNPPETHMDIVLASQEYDLRLALEMLFREQPGAYVVGAASHTDALLALIRTACPDVVLLDWDLPGQPLAEVLAELDSIESRPKIIVLGKDPDTRPAALAARADAFVVKGEPPNQLLVAFHQVSSES